MTKFKNMNTQDIITKNIGLNGIMSKRGNNALVDTDDSDDGSPTNLHTPKRSIIQNCNNM